MYRALTEPGHSATHPATEGSDRIRHAPTHKEYELMSDPNATHRISREDLFRDDEEQEEESPDPNATARISRADLFDDGDSTEAKK